MNGREVAKFASGFAASQAVTHGAMAAAGVQLTMFGITYGPRLDATAAIVWTGVLVGLAYFAWIRRS